MGCTSCWRSIALKILEMTGGDDGQFTGISMTEKEKAAALQAFLACDKDGNGTIEYDEMADALKKVYPNLTGPLINRIYRLMDTDRSGVITIDEFMRGIKDLRLDLSKVHTEKGISKEYEWEVPYNELVFGKTLGEGSFGTVWRGSWRGTSVAIKKLKAEALDDAMLDDFKSEIAILGKLRHPNVLLFMGASTVSPNFCIVTEYMEAGSVFDKISKSKIHDPQLIIKIALQAAQGCNYLHLTKPRPIIHRDLKSMNLLIDSNWNVKLADFGLSCIKKSDEMNELVGTPVFMAPELWEGKSYNEKVDVYSFGVVLWELITGDLPFNGYSMAQVQKSVVQGLRPRIPANCDPALAALIQRCWQSNPDARPSMGEIVEELKKMLH